MVPVRAVERTDPLVDPWLEQLLLPGALRAVVQPIIRLADAQVVGYEALSRSVAPLPHTPDQWV